MKSLIIIVPILFAPFCFGQDSLTVKNTESFEPINSISIDGLGSFPFLRYLYGKNSIKNAPFQIYDQALWKESGGELKKKQQYFDYGVRFVFMHRFTKRVGLGFELNGEFTKINPDYWSDGYGYAGTNYQRPNGVMTLRHEAVNTSSYSILPVFEWKTKKSRDAFFGISQQFGIGYTFTKIMERDYKYELDYVYTEKVSSEPFPGAVQYGNLYILEDSTTYNPSEFYDYSQIYHGIKVMYAMQLRKKLSEHLALNFGVRFNFNYYTKAYVGYEVPDNEEDSKYWMDKNKMVKVVGRTRLFSLCFANVGLTYIF